MAREKLKKTGRTVRWWVRALLLLITLFLIAVIVTAVIIAQDPNSAANGVNGVFDALDDGAKAVLRAPIDFFSALNTFVERLFN